MPLGSLPPLMPLETLAVNIAISYITLTRKGSVIRHILVQLAGILGLISGYCLLSALGVKNFVAYYALNIAIFIPIMVLFAETLPQKVFLFFSVWSVSSFASSLCNYASDWLGDGPDAITLRFALYTISLAGVLVSHQFWGKYRVRRFLALFKEENPVYAAFPALAFIVFVALFGPVFAPESLKWFVNMILYQLFVLFAYFLLFISFESVHHRKEAEERLRETERYMLLQKKYYAEIDRGIRAQRDLLHDIRHHLLAVDALAKNGNYAELSLYVESLQENYGRRFTKRYCGNVTVNAVLGGYIEIAEEKGIGVSTELDIPGNIGIDEFDLCVLFGNAVENAIEACLRIPPESRLFADRSLSVKARLESDRLVVMIANSCLPDPVSRDSPVRDVPPEESARFPSSKGEFGGIGLESVRSVVERNSGCLNCEKRGGSFILSAVLCIRENTVADKM
jgi:hypothetical protein